MGSYDGAEICELVGLYLLNQLSTVIDKSSVGLLEMMGLLQKIMQMIQSLTELGKILHYSRKKDFQSPSKQILSKQTF